METAPTTTTDRRRAVLDTSVLFALLVYAIAAWLVGALLGWVGDFLASTATGDHRDAR